MNYLMMALLALKVLLAAQGKGEVVQLITDALDNHRDLTPEELMKIHKILAAEDERFNRNFPTGP